MEDHKKIFVADASVLLKWALSETQEFEQAIALKKQFTDYKIDIIVPANCFAEICNMLGRERPDIALSYISYLIVSGINEYRISLNLAGIAFSLMKKYSGISFYDALYHALAIQEKNILITADVKYFNKTHKEGHIMLLKDYGKTR